MHPSEGTINDYVDGLLSEPARADVERHAAGCSVCAQLIGDLQQLTQTAAALPDQEPPASVWPRIADRLDQYRSAGSTHRTWRQRPVWALAAAAVVMLAVLAGVRYAHLLTPRPAVDQPADLARSVEIELREAEAHYQKAIDGLQQIADAETGALDPATAAALRDSLAVIDRAISESRAALKTDPGSIPAQESLLQGLRAKVALLQDAVSLINDLRTETRTRG